MNGYEIRLELLKLAEGILVREYDTDTTIYINSIAGETTLAAFGMDDSTPKAEPNKPKAPTVENIVEEAGKLQKFIDAKPNH